MLKKLTAGALVLVLCVVVVLGLTAGQSKKNPTLGTAATTILIPDSGTTVDTTEAWRVNHSGGVGYVLKWTEEDSISVTIQTTLDHGTNWVNFGAAQTIDGGTTGPFLIARALAFNDFAGGMSTGGFANLPPGTHVRAIFSSAGSDTVSDVDIMFAIGS